MQNIKRVSGFSELKKILIDRFQIKRDPNLIRLHFSIQENALVIHDYDYHHLQIESCKHISDTSLAPGLMTPAAEAVVFEALDKNDPALALNLGFKLNGTYRPKLF